MSTEKHLSTKEKETLKEQLKETRKTKISPLPKDEETIELTPKQKELKEYVIKKEKKTFGTKKLMVSKNDFKPLVDRIIQQLRSDHSVKH
ncbi:hypothetical protein QTN25_005653 [Entamoeba marina]